MKKTKMQRTRELVNDMVDLFESNRKSGEIKDADDLVMREKKADNLCEKYSISKGEFLLATQRLVEVAAVLYPDDTINISF